MRRANPTLRESVRGGIGYAAALAVVTASAIVGWFAFGEDRLTDAVMVFLLGVFLVSMRFGYGPSLVATSLSVLAFEFFFIPPHFSFAVTDMRHFVTFGVMLFVAVVTAHLTRQVREQARAARAREQNVASLYAASRDIGLALSRESLLASAAKHAAKIFGGRTAVLLPGPGGRLEIAASHGAATMSSAELYAAERVFRNEPAPAGEHPARKAAQTVFARIEGSKGAVGVLAIVPGGSAAVPDAERGVVLATCASLIGSALERTALAEEALRATLRIETEQMRNALLSSVSHDLRTPIGVVTGAMSALLECGPSDERRRRELMAIAHREALHLSRLVGNLVDMTRLEAGSLLVRKELQSLEEVVGSALSRLEESLRDREVDTRFPMDLPLVPFDPILIEQVLLNLLENATKHTPPGGAVEVSAAVRNGEMQVEVSDRGPGVPLQDVDRVFEKFYRSREREGGGMGLGLTICRGIVRAHGGRIWVEDRPGGGASFRFTLPLEEGSRMLGAAEGETR
jgi:two-component system sensor histidine kinase KdpD